MPRVSQLTWTWPSISLKVLLHNYCAICVNMGMFDVLLSLPGESRAMVRGSVSILGREWGEWKGPKGLGFCSVRSTSSPASGRQVLSYTNTVVLPSRLFLNLSVLGLSLHLCHTHKSDVEADAPQLLPIRLVSTFFLPLNIFSFKLGSHAQRLPCLLIILHFSISSQETNDPLSRGFMSHVHPNCSQHQCSSLHTGTSILLMVPN